MNFINRLDEMNRLLQVVAQSRPALVVIWGRRRFGKSRLLTEWCRKVNGTYWVADESAPAIQRRYLAEELSAVFPGFADVSYPDWSVLLKRLASEARQVNWHGPLVLDEFPYLVSGAPELPSVLQKWIDREKREGGIVLALSGSSQRMMLDSVLNSSAPLYGRADELFKLEPLLPGYIGEATSLSDPQSLLDFYTCWGGVARYWELAQPFKGNFREALDERVLSPLGVLHDEVNRLLREETPSAMPLRPIMDAIGLGAHRTSEIAARLQIPATSLSRSLTQLQQLGYIRREIPYGENEKSSKKALYRLSDPFLRLWFKVVAPHRGILQTASKPVRIKWLENNWPGLRAQAWEELCQMAIPYLRLFQREWQPAGRYWAGNQSEWDVVCKSLDDDILILGECKSLAHPATRKDIDKTIRALMAKTVPDSIGRMRQHEYVIFVPEHDQNAGPLPENIHIVDGQHVFRALVAPHELIG